MLKYIIRLFFHGDGYLVIVYVIYFQFVGIEL